MKKNLIKLSTLLLALLVGISLASCGGNKKDVKYNKNVPYGDLSDSTVYASLSATEKLTEKGLYDEMRSNAYSLLQEKILNTLIKPETYNLNTTDNEEELIKIINTKCYGVEDIKDLSKESKVSKVKPYIDQLYLLGIDLNINVNEITVDNIDSINIYTEEVKEYYLPLLAQKYYARTIIENEDGKYYWKNKFLAEKDENGKKQYNPYYIDDEALEARYESEVKSTGEYNVIVVAFPTIANSEVKFDVENLKTLDDEAIKNYFIAQYEEQYPYKEKDFTFTDKELEGYDATLVSLISKMKTGDYFVNKQFGDLVYNVYLVEEKADVEYNEDEVREKIIDGYVSQSFISVALSELLSDTKVEIYDPVFDALYAVDNVKHERLTAKEWKDEYKNYVAKVGDTTISVREFYEELEMKLGISCAMDYFTILTLLKDTSSLTEKDLKDIKKEYKDTIKAFKEDTYASNGFPSSIGEDIFKFLYYGTSDEAEILEFYKSQKLWDYAIKEYPENYFDILEQFSKQYAENYFSLSVKHILIYVDYDMDGTPDDPAKFVENLKINEYGKEQLEADILALMNAVIKEVNYIVEQDYQTLVDALDYVVKSFYRNDTLLSTGESWSKYSDRFNLCIKVEDLSEVNNSNASSYVTAFGEGVKELYSKLKEAEKLDEDYLAELASFDELIETVYGYHTLAVYDSTEMSTAKYEESKDTANQYAEIKVKWNDEELTLNAYNENDYASKNQLQIYAAQEGTSDGIKNLPTTVKNYIAKFYSEFKTRYEDSQFQNILLAKNKLSGLTFADSLKNAEFNEFIEIQKRQFDSYADYQISSDNVFAGWWEAFLA